MAPNIALFKNETGWDALSDEFQMVVRVMSGPASLEEIAEVMGEKDLVAARKRVSRLVREGIVIEQGGTYQAPAKLIDSVPQEGLLTSISRHVMPIVTTLANDPSCGFVVQLDLDLDEADQEAFCKGMEQGLIEELNEESDRPGVSQQAYSMFVLGTSDVPPAAPQQERLIETLKRYARQRSNPRLASRTLLRCFTAHFGDPANAENIVRNAANRMERGGLGTRFTVVYGFCSNSRIVGGRS